MASQRVQNMDGFTSKSHSQISTILAPSQNQLKPGFTVLVIGASGAIGAGVARSYARAGCSDLVLAGRNLDALKNLSEEITFTTHVHSEERSTTKTYIQHCDIASADSVRTLTEFISSSFPTLDCVVLVSGISGPVELRITDGSPSDGQWAQVFNTNTLGTYHVAHYFIPLLLQSETKAFLAVGSLAACITEGMIANTKYCVSKFAQARIVECIANQFGEEGLLALSVHPGAVGSENALKTAPEEFIKYLTDDPHLCGAFCVWLSRDASRFSWLNGRLISATWDPEELLAKKEDVVKGDLLKFEARTTLDL